MEVSANSIAAEDFSTDRQALEPCFDRDDEVNIDLLAAETATLIYFPSISSLTRFRGHLRKDVLVTRVWAVLQANPWLCGRLKSVEGRVQLVHPKELNDESLHGIFGVSRTDINLEQGYSALVQRCCVQPGYWCIDADEPLFRVVIFERRSSDAFGVGEFSVCVSLSHVIGDGQTYYQVFGMLGEGAQVFALQPARQTKFDQTLKDVLGEEEALWIGSLSFKLSVVSSYLFRTTRPHLCVLEVNSDWIANQKQAHKQLVTSDSSLPPFISTNDILTSWFSCFCKADVILIPVNFRCFRSELSAHDAGNYIGLAPYAADVSAGAASVRQFVARFHVDPLQGTAHRECHLPGIFSSVVSRISLVTNWTHVFKPLIFNGCEELLHMPVGFSPALDAMVVFNIAPTRIGLCCILVSMDSETLIQKAEADAMGRLFLQI